MGCASHAPLAFAPLVFTPKGSRCLLSPGAGSIVSSDMAAPGRSPPSRVPRPLGGGSSLALLLSLGLLLLWAGPTVAQQQPEPPGPAAPITALVEQLVALFPTLQGEVLEVQGATLTLDVGRKDGGRPGLTLEVFRQGREIKHPRTGEVLGRTEQRLGTVSIAEVQESFSVARLGQGGEVRPGDRFRLSAGRIKLVLLPLLGGARENLVEAATHELVERLNASGRFQVAMGDAINVFLSQEGLKAEDVLEGRGVKQVAERFKLEHLLAVHFKRVQNRPYMEVRFFSLPRPEAAVSAAFFVPASIRAASQSSQFSASGRTSNPPQAKPRSLLARLLGGDVEAGAYSSGESALPLKEVARFPFPVLAMDVAVHPTDRIPRIVVTDSEKVYVYKIVRQKLEPEWTISARSMGRVVSVQLVDLNGDGTFEVVGNRWHPESGLNSFIIGTKDGKPRFLADDIGFFLLAVDLKGDGYKQTLWTQPPSPEKFFSHGQAEQVVLKSGKLVTDKAVRVHAAFRPMGATFSNIAGKDTRALAFVDDFNRLQIALEGEDLWRSSSAVGGGYMTVEVINREFFGGRSKFFKIEPAPLAVDLDGDGIEEIVVPQNTVKEGLLAVIFKGPAGFRLQSVESGFEGPITGLGAFRTEDSAQPTLVASVVRFKNFLKQSGETQIIMTVPQE